MERYDQEPATGREERTPLAEETQEPDRERAAKVVGREPGREPGQERMAGAETRQTESAGRTAEGERDGLLAWHEAEGYRRRWETLQGSFVDDPKSCVEQADALVIEVLQRMSQVRDEHRNRIRGAVEGSDNASTEDFRLAMQQYRSFFRNLLQS